MLYERRLAGVGQVFICDAGERGTLALLPDFTDRVVPVASAALDVRVLTELARVMRAVEGR